jgi:hypothetical protein
MAFSESQAAPDSVYGAVTLGHVTNFLRDYIRKHWSILRSADFKDPAFGFLVLQEKAERGLKTGTPVLVAGRRTSGIVHSVQVVTTVSILSSSRGMASAEPCRSLMESCVLFILFTAIDNRLLEGSKRSSFGSGNQPFTSLSALRIWPGKRLVATRFRAFRRGIRAHKMLTEIREQEVKPDIKSKQML